MCYGRHWQKGAFDAKSGNGCVPEQETSKYLSWFHSIFCILFIIGKTSCWVPGKNSRLELGLKRVRSAGQTQEEKALYEWNACVQITTWGNRVAADQRRTY